MNLQARLAKFPNFAHFDEKGLSLLASALEQRSFEEGDVIVEEGARGTELFVLLEGRVIIVKKSAGKVRELGGDNSGQIFGLMTLLLDTRRSATVRAVEDVKVGVLTRYAFDLLYRHNGPASTAFCELVSRQLVGDARAIHDAFFEHEKIQSRTEDFAELTQSQTRLNEVLHAVQSVN